MVEDRPFLDISGPVQSGGNEQGLLSLVFEPNYLQNGYFYVYYTYDPAGTNNDRTPFLAGPVTFGRCLQRIVVVRVDHKIALVWLRPQPLDRRFPTFLYNGSGTILLLQARSPTDDAHCEPLRAPPQLAYAELQYFTVP